MIYVMSKKFFIKKIEKMAKYNRYLALDGENYAITDSQAKGKSPISSKYANTHAVGGFCPERWLYSKLVDMKKGKEVDKEKFDKNAKKFLKDKTFIASMNVAYKSVVAGGPDNPINIFIILPNVVYKYLGKKIIKKLKKLGDLDFQCVFSQKDIEEDFKILKKQLSSKQMKAIDDMTRKVEKKHKLKFEKDDDEY